jgi:hypothetical protein
MEEKTKQQWEALQNAANEVKLIIYVWPQEDNRKKKPLFIATKRGSKCSPVLDYLNMNSFLLGWIKCSQS